MASAVTSTATTRAASSGGIVAAAPAARAGVSRAPIAGTRRTPRTSTSPARRRVGVGDRGAVGCEQRDVGVVPSHPHDGNPFGDRDAQRPGERARHLGARDPRQLFDARGDRRGIDAQQRCTGSDAGRARDGCGVEMLQTRHAHVVDVEERRLHGEVDGADRDERDDGTEDHAQPLAAGLALDLDAPLADARIDRGGHRTTSE